MPRQSRVCSQYVKASVEINDTSFLCMIYDDCLWSRYVSSPQIAEELSLLQRQEAYIAQLEKETSFCRDQLSYVLRHVKDVLREKETQSRSDDVHKAISNIFATINGWQQNNIDPNAGSQGSNGNISQQQQQEMAQEITFLKVKITKKGKLWGAFLQFYGIFFIS